MLRQLITFIVVVAVIGGGVYLLVFKRGAVERSAKGFKAAETPQVAADMFAKAIKEREFKIAADYCTKEFAEQLNRGGDAAKKLSTAIDDLTFRLNSDMLLRDEVKIVFFYLDPFPKDVQISVSPESNGTAEATFTLQIPTVVGTIPDIKDWNLKPEIFQVYNRSVVVAAAPSKVKMKKEADGWKFDLPADPALQARVEYLNSKHMNYVNPMEVVSTEVKRDATTKEDVTGRLKKLLSKGAQE